MSAACKTPGPKSLEALAWLARVGATPLEPLQLVMGCSQRRAQDHLRRLTAAKLIRRVAMTRGHGSLIVITPAGAATVGLPAAAAPRAHAIAPTTWAHASGCAWVSAWLQLRGRSWISEREILDDDFWRHELRYEDHRGTARISHRPDLGVLTGEGPVAIEVELQRKALARLRGICTMYAQLTEPNGGPLAGVIYITSRDDVAERVADIADAVGLHTLSLRTMHDVVAQTQIAAGTMTPAGRGVGEQA